MRGKLCRHFVRKLAGRCSALSTVAVVLVVASTPGMALPCYPESADAAQSGAEEAKDWQSLYATFARYGICDDGVVAEAFSDSIASILAKDWMSVSTLDRLARMHPKFRQFVLRHIDSLMTPDQAHAIEQNAQRNCAVEVKVLCGQIAKRARDATRG